MNQSIESELESYKFSFPILEFLSAELGKNSAFAGSRIGWHCHLTGLTAAAARLILNAGAELHLSECSSATTSLEAVNHMREAGAEVYLGESGKYRVLEACPQVISDTGFELCAAYVQAESGFLRAACEITTSGIQRLKSLAELSFPVVNINDGELKSLIENFHGVGDGVIDALFRCSGRIWSGRKAAVVGYGRVGAGVAHHLRQAQAIVSVVETCPVRKLLAHYDGFALETLQGALSGSELLVTATGAKSVVSASEFSYCRDGIILMNVGHWPDEIDLAALRKESQSCRLVSQHLEEFELKVEDKRTVKIHVIGGGGPANVVMLSGSCEATLIHLCTEILTLAYLLTQENAVLVNGENPLPKAVERQASALALKALYLE